MAYTPEPFEYAFKSFDATDLTPDTADLFSARDVQLQNYLQTQTSSISSELTTVNDSLANKADARTWSSWTCAMLRGTTSVSVSTTSATFSFTDGLAFVNCEAQVTSTTSFPGNQTLSFFLPIFAQPETRVLGHGMWQSNSVFYYCLAFIEGTSGGNYAVFLPDRGQPWLGQTLTGNPTISGTQTGSTFYMNLVYRV